MKICPKYVPWENSLTDCQFVLVAGYEGQQEKRGSARIDRGKDEVKAAGGARGDISGPLEGQQLCTRYVANRGMYLVGLMAGVGYLRGVGSHCALGNIARYDTRYVRCI